MPTSPDDAPFSDDFGGTGLDLDVWVPHHLPAWSSRAVTATTHAVRDSCLHLTIPPEQGLWCAGDHEPAMRVSAVQSGSASGPVGSAAVVPGAADDRRLRLPGPVGRGRRCSRARARRRPGPRPPAPTHVGTWLASAPGVRG